MQRGWNLARSRRGFHDYFLAARGVGRQECGVWSAEYALLSGTAKFALMPAGRLY